ncbi:MAG: radical SAM protein [Synergistaceae bacterium]|jgi:pyruvate formate lyase activating enzyme|nr:radical SAM protein [Synergistaceae bacterium]
MDGIRPRWWSAVPCGAGDIAARCGLCFHACLIPSGGSGYCGARRFSGGVFESPLLGKFVSLAVDPIEKKPIYHWRPGTKILSLGGFHCNMSCPFCQNHAIAHPSGGVGAKGLSPEELAETALSLGLSSVAYTYNEPTLQAEYIISAAPVLRDAGIASVMVTNGLFSMEVCAELAAHVAAMNVDVKTFDGNSYSRLAGSSSEGGPDALSVVMENVESLCLAGVHVELTNLVVPGVSESEADFAGMVAWIAGISHEIPLHISRYFPAYRYMAPATDIGLMKRFESVARKKLKFVHLGNVW